MSAHLDAGPGLQLAEAADERPAAGRDVGHLGDGLHPLWTRDAHLGTRTRINTATREDTSTL